MDYTYENEAIKKGYKLVCGVDEAGRGPLCGRVYAAAVILDNDIKIEGLADSKKLTPLKREKLYDEIINKALCYCVAYSTEKEIDEMNILNASLLAMKRAVFGLKIKPDFIIVDGNRLPDFECDAKALVKGDDLSPSVAAASILAKVERDRYMEELDKIYPQYNLKKHKGYGTKEHYELIKKYGIADIYRKTFLKNIKEKM